MEDHLKRLLEAEARAQGIIDAANAERQQALDEALTMAHDAEVRFAAGRTELRSPFIEEAHRRAEHVIAELARKYDERQRKLREMAAHHEAEAIDAAVNLLLDPET